MATIPLIKKGVCPLSTRQIIDRVLVFTGEVCRVDLYLYQKEFAREVVLSLLLDEGGTLTCMFARQAGKSEVVADIALALTLILPSLARVFPEDDRLKKFRHGFRVGIFAPSNKHSYIVYSRMRSRVESAFFEQVLADPDIDTRLIHSRGDSFAFDNGSVVEAHTASSNVLNEGGTFHLIITDETQRLEGSKINKELRPMLAATNGTLVEIGTAFMSACQFKRDIVTNIGLERSTGKKRHFQFDYEQCIDDRRRMYEQTGDPSHLGYEKWVQGELARVGGNVEDESFRMNFRLMWSESHAQAIDMTLFLSLKREDIEINNPLDVLAKLGPGRFVAGLDVARDGDRTWTTVGHVDILNGILDDGALQPGQYGPREPGPAIYYPVTLVGWLVTQGNFEGDYGQYSLVKQFLSLWPGLDTFVVDATGMGDPVWERFSVLLPHINVIPYTYSLPSKHVLYRWYFQEQSAKRFHYAAGPETIESDEYKEFVKEHEDLVREYSGNYMRVFAGDTDSHDDAPDSTALMCFGAKQEGIPLVDQDDRNTVRGAPLIEVDISEGRSILGRGVVTSRSSRYSGKRVA